MDRDQDAGAPMIDMKGLCFGHAQDRDIFCDLTLSLARGRITSIIGPSGCGKSTLLYLLAGLLTPRAGTIEVDGRAMTRPRPDTGLVLQDHGLLPWAGLARNIRLGLDIRSFYGPDARHAPTDWAIPRHEGRRRVHDWMQRLGIAELAGAYPGQVSRGQRQRAAIARTLVLEPDLLLLDEPFSALDARTTDLLHRLVFELVNESGLSVVMVTHDIDEAALMGQAVVALHGSPGTPPVVLDNPGAGNFDDPRALEDMRLALRQTLGAAS
jgi:NitT/TauT family transport system ATP-binding protein